MQALTGGPRAALSIPQVARLLEGTPALTVAAGLDLLDSDLQLVEDLSQHLESGTVERSMLAPIHGTCRLRLSTELAWGTALVRPYQLLTSDGVTARFDLGVYALTTPDRTLGQTPATYDVEGYDRLYLLDRPVGDTWAVGAGSGYLAAVRNVIASAGLSGVQLDGAANFATLPADQVWPFVDAGGGTSTTWLQVANDLLAAVGYRGLYADPATGVFRSEPYTNPTSRTPEHTFSASGDASTVGEDRTEDVDLWAAPNVWVFVQQNRPTTSAAPTEGDGIYIVRNEDDGPTSISARGLEWTRIVSLDAASQASLIAQGDVLVAADRRTSRTITATTSPFPAAGHADVYLYDDPELGDPIKVQAREWELDLAGGDMRWTFEAVQ